jgi:hypothetical protein
MDIGGTGGVITMGPSPLYVKNIMWLYFVFSFLLLLF